jgi:signal recognition particle subunit SRP54
MMQQIGQAPGLLGQLPGFKQLAQMRNLRNMNMNDVFGNMPGMPKGMNIADLASQIPPGMMPPGMQMPPGMMAGRPVAGKPQQSKGEKKNKRKAQKAARKKSRR